MSAFDPKRTLGPTDFCHAKFDGLGTSASGPHGNVSRAASIAATSIFFIRAKCALCLIAAGG
jgi:hypothetical protein